MFVTVEKQLHLKILPPVAVCRAGVCQASASVSLRGRVQVWVLGVGLGVCMWRGCTRRRESKTKRESIHDFLEHTASIARAVCARGCDVDDLPTYGPTNQVTTGPTD